MTNLTMASWLSGWCPYYFYPMCQFKPPHAHFFSAFYLTSSFTLFQWYILMCPPFVLSTFFTLLLHYSLASFGSKYYSKVCCTEYLHSDWTSPIGKQRRRRRRRRRRQLWATLMYRHPNPRVRQHKTKLQGALEPQPWSWSVFPCYDSWAR